MYFNFLLTFISCSLIIQNVDVKDDGPYTITATNNQGETVAQAKLIVHTEKPHFLKGPEDQCIHDYAETEQRVRAQGIPKPELKWLKDGKPLHETELDEDTNEPKYKMEFSSINDEQVAGSFAIEHFRLKHAGNVIHLIHLFNRNVVKMFV